MRLFKISILVAFMIVAAGVSSAADWTTLEGGSAVCTKIRQDGTCWVETAGENSSAMSVGECPRWTIVVWDTGASVMPQGCTDKTCSTAEDLLANPLTGDSPNTFLTSTVPFNFVRLSTASSVTVTIKCGR